MEGMIGMESVDANALVSLASLYGAKIIFALAIFFVGKWVAKKLANLVKKMMLKANVDATLTGFAGNILYGMLLALVVIAALSKVGIETTSLAAVIAAAGLAIGLALQGSLSNFAAGVMVILFRPFKNGDYVEAAGTAGVVEEISIFTTVLKTPDNKKVIVPNNEITSGNIINYSANPTRRLDMVVGVSYDDDLKKVRKSLEKILAKEDRILKDPETVIAVLELADSSVNFAVRPWVKTEDFWPVKFALTEAIKTTFDKEGISIPFPQRDVHVIDDSAIATKKKAA